MNKLFMWILAVVVVILCGASSRISYVDNQDNAAAKAAYIPKAPDYGDSKMWTIVDGDTTGTGADIFYVVSTWEEDWTTDDGRVCHYADVWNPVHREHMGTLEIKKVAAYMSPGNRFYAPYYRHTTIEAFMLNK